MANFRLVPTKGPKFKKISIKPSFDWGKELAMLPAFDEKH
jgi:hypothetical protein